MPITCLVIEKKGSIKEIQLTSYDETQLYKKAGFKTETGFELQTEWGAQLGNKSYSVSVFGKTDGRAGQENKYEFPPPIDNVLLFGSCILVNKQQGEAKDLTKEEWKKIYEHLFGGFEDIGEEDSDFSEDDLDEDVPRTKEGYVKDDFIVEDEEEEEDETEEEEEEEEVYVKKTKKPTKKTSTKKEKKPVKNAAVVPVQEEVQGYLDCTNELEEEAYIQPLTKP